MQLLHFTATWCNPCKKMEPVIEEFLASNAEIKYTKVDVDDQSPVAHKHGVMGIPTFIALDGEEEKTRATGVMSIAKLQAMFN